LHQSGSRPPCVVPVACFAWGKKRKGPQKGGVSRERRPQTKPDITQKLKLVRLSCRGPKTPGPVKPSWGGTTQPGWGHRDQQRRPQKKRLHTWGEDIANLSKTRHAGLCLTKQGISPKTDETPRPYKSSGPQPRQSNNYHHQPFPGQQAENTAEETRTARGLQTWRLLTATRAGGERVAGKPVNPRTLVQMRFEDYWKDVGKRPSHNNNPARRVC